MEKRSESKGPIGRSESSKIAFLFPGQGSQSQGMGKDLYDSYPEAKETFEAIDKIAGRELSKLCFEGPEAELKRTVNTQPTIMQVSLAAWKAYEKLGGPAPDFVAGHSLGEITALVAAGSLTLEDAVRLIDKRARLMEEAPKGAMAAVLKVSPEVLEEIAATVHNHRLSEGKSASEAVVVCANFNSREQLVISGNPDAVSEAAKKAKEAGGKAIPLPVGGAFHSPLMTQAAREFESELNKADLKDARCDVVQNYDARAARSTAAIKAKLAKQMESPVRWYESIEFMVSNGVDTFVEIGPGAVLTGLVKKINPNVKLININDTESLKAAINDLKHPVAR